MFDNGMEVRPSAKPPSAWHACVLSASVLAKSLDRMEGISGANAGTNRVGSWIQRSWIAFTKSAKIDRRDDEYNYL